MDRVEDAISHLSAAVTQSIPSDDQIIIGHVRDALALLREHRAAERVWPRVSEVALTTVSPPQSRVRYGTRQNNGGRTMSENKFEAAARLLKALRKVDERHRARVVKSETKCAAERGELLEAADLDVRNMVLAEGGK